VYQFECINFTEYTSPLGKGEFGIVYKAVLHTNSLDSEDLSSTTLVAVKTVDPVTADIVCFKALLDELKVMSYVGTHPHIVNLVGANTEQIKQSKPFIDLFTHSMINLVRVGTKGIY
jgi:serine/threonine protein kinase